MKPFYHAAKRVVLCLFQWIFLPLAPVADDRIFAAKTFAQALGMSEELRQQKRYWSILSILKRAACRQERMNKRGQQKFDKLQSKQWDLPSAFKWHAKILLWFFALWYGVEALDAVARAHSPWLHDFIVRANASVNSFIYWLWSFVPGPE